MNIEAFLLCECATEGAGKLNVLGAFDIISSKKMPVVHPACTIAARIRFDKIEEGEHSVRIHIIDQDGNNIGPKLEGSISVRTRPGQDSMGANLILNIQRLEFKQYGQYRIDLAIDGNVKASLPLRLIEIQD